MSGSSPRFHDRSDTVVMPRAARSRRCAGRMRGRCSCAVASIGATTISTQPASSATPVSSPLGITTERGADRIGCGAVDARSERGGGVEVDRVPGVVDHDERNTAGELVEEADVGVGESALQQRVPSVREDGFPVGLRDRRAQSCEDILGPGHDHGAEVDDQVGQKDRGEPGMPVRLDQPGHDPSVEVRPSRRRVGAANLLRRTHGHDRGGRRPPWLRLRCLCSARTGGCGR